MGKVFDMGKNVYGGEPLPPEDFMRTLADVSQKEWAKQEARAANKIMLVRNNSGVSLKAGEMVSLEWSEKNAEWEANVLPKVVPDVDSAMMKAMRYASRMLTETGDDTPKRSPKKEKKIDVVPSGKRSIRVE